MMGHLLFRIKLFFHRFNDHIWIMLGHGNMILATAAGPASNRYGRPHPPLSLKCN
jgi:hypothetical protein